MILCSVIIVSHVRLTNSHHLQLLHHLLHPPHTENKRMFQIKIDLIIAHFTSGSVFFLLLNNIIANMVEINVIIKSFDKY